MREQDVLLRTPWDPGAGLVLSGESDDASVVGPIARTGEYAPNILRWLKHVVQPGWVVLDVGANIGPVSLPLAQLVGPMGTVHAFEPAPVSYRHLVNNVHRNNVENVVTHRLALSNEVGLASLAYDPHFAGGAHVARRGAREAIDVPACTLDEWIASESVRAST